MKEESDVLKLKLTFNIKSEGRHIFVPQACNGKDAGYKIKNKHQWYLFKFITRQNCPTNLNHIAFYLYAALNS